MRFSPPMFHSKRHLFTQAGPFLAYVFHMHHSFSFCVCASGFLKDIYLHSPNVRWEDIIGLEDAKRLVKEAVVYPIKVRPLPEHAGISAPLAHLRF